MYSVVLMAALTTGGDAVDCHRHKECAPTYSCGCSGSTYVAPGGCYGGGVYYGGGMGGPPKEKLEKMPGKKEDPKKEDPKKEDPKKEEEGKIGSRVAPGRIVVTMPADARFTVDDYTSPARSDTHIVVSTPLGAQETKTYVLKAEVIRDGKVQTMEQSVTVRAGEETKVTLSLSTAVAAR